MKLDHIYIQGSDLERFEEKLEDYNSCHEGEEISFQQLAEKLLEHAIRYVPVECVS